MSSNLKTFWAFVVALMRRLTSAEFAFLFMVSTLTDLSFHHQSSFLTIGVSLFEIAH